jgi:hypothetical protein
MRKRSGTRSREQVPGRIEEGDGARDLGRGHGLALDGGELGQLGLRLDRAGARDAATCRPRPGR